MQRAWLVNSNSGLRLKLSSLVSAFGLSERLIQNVTWPNVPAFPKWHNFSSSRVLVSNNCKQSITVYDFFKLLIFNDISLKIGSACQWENCLTCRPLRFVSKDLVRKLSFPVTLTKGGSWALLRKSAVESTALAQQFCVNKAVGDLPQRLHAQFVVVRQFSHSLFRSTSESRPNSIEGKNVRPYVRLYVRPSTKSFFNLNEIWYIGRGWWLMQDDMSDRRSRSRSRALQSLNSFHFQNLSPPPFTTGAGKWPLILKLGHNI